MEISYRNSFWDFVRFNLYQTFRSKISLAALGLVLFSVGRIALDVARAVDYSSFGKVMAFSIVLVAGFGIFLLFVMVLIFVSAFISYLARKTKSGECKIQVTENSLITESSVARSEIQWSGINAIKQNKNFILIYISKRMAFVVPKRAFAHETDANKFFTYMGELWRKSKH